MLDLEMRKKEAIEIDAVEKQIEQQAKSFDYFSTEYSIGLIADKFSDGDFCTAPFSVDYNWDLQIKYRFIESIVLNIPLPYLFFWENKKKKALEIIDGLQRLKVITEFIKGDFKLGDLYRLPLISGLSFKDLPESRQLKIKNRSIRAFIIDEHADEETRENLYDRLHT